MSKQKKTAFTFFLEEWKVKEMKKGRKFVCSNNSLFQDPQLNSDWSKLTTEEKARYVEKAKAHKQEGKKTCTGESVSVLKANEQKEKDFKEKMEIYISTTLEKAIKNETIKNLPFIVIHINFYYRRQLGNDTLFYPAEVALTKFSLVEGIIKTYCKFVKSDIVMGYANEASNISNNSHQIPTNPNFSDNTYRDIYRDILKFLEPSKINNKLPFVYTRDQFKNSVQSSLQLLHDNYGDDAETFDLYSFETLATQLHNKKNPMKNYVENLNIKLKKDPYNYEKSIGCKFHRTIGIGGLNDCSRSFTFRWIFTLFDEVLHVYDIERTPIYHSPCKSMEDENNIYDSLQESSEDEKNIHDPLQESLDNLSVSGSNQVEASSNKVVQNEVSNKEEFFTVNNKKKKRTNSVSSGTWESSASGTDSCATSWRLDTSENSNKSAEFLDNGAMTFSRNKPSRGPLRCPFTKPISSMIANRDLDTDFPPIGRGDSRRNRGTDKKPGKNYSSFF